ncbi:MAG: hypothetical protein AAF797_14575 [Planctomycetota bacterium]
MTKLEDTKIYRGGATAPDMSFETSECEISFFHPYRKQGNSQLMFRFSMASKGGGTTVVDMHVGSKDLSEIIQLVGNEIPSLCDSLCKGASAAAEKNQQAIENLERQIAPS